jgi:hypothetical protein
MALIVRTFRSHPGWQAVIGQCLSRLASGTIRHLGATLVMVFRQANDPQRLLWLGDRGEEGDVMRLALPPVLAESLDEGLAESSPGQRFTMVYASVKAPRAPYQIWSLEVHAPASAQGDVLGAVLGDSSAISRDRWIPAMSFYRAIEPPDALVGFLGLTWGATPSGIGLCLPQVDAPVVWRPLALVYAAERMSGGIEASSLPFWMGNGGAAADRPRSSPDPGASRLPLAQSSGLDLPSASERE